MTHTRKTESLKQSLTDVVEALGGSQRVAKLLDVGQSTVDAWKNPARPSFASAEQIIILDAWYAQKAGTVSPTPIIMSMIQAVETNLSADRSMNVLDELIQTRTVIEALTAALIQKARNENLGQPVEFSKSESEQLMAACFDAVRMLTRLSIHLQRPTEVKSVRKLSVIPQVD